MTPIEMRQATIDDLALVTDLLAQLYGAHDYDKLCEENKHHLADDTQVMLLAHDGTAVVGIAHAAVRREYVEGRFDNLPIGYLEAVFVLPEHRKRGVARSLVTTCEHWARERSCSAFASDCELDNINSQRFHERIGFRETSRNIHFIKEIEKDEA